MLTMLSLTVREITSVSATFILSSRLDSSADPSLVSLGLESLPSSDQQGTNEIVDVDRGNKNSHPHCTGISSPNIQSTGTSPLIADALAKGLSVTVNGSAWPRTFIRIDEQVDEAVIIIYALMPGRQYDIELGLACAGQMGDDNNNERVLKSRVITQDNEIEDDPESQNDSTSTSTSPSSSESHSTPSTSPSITALGTPPPPPPLPPSSALAQASLNDRLAQLQQTLSNVNTERETIFASLKSLRRESQKADAALRAEIETLKRTSEKNTAAEVRSRQKLLALQEAVKRAQNAAKESEGMTKEVASEISLLMKKKEEKEIEHRRVQDEAGSLKRERTDVEERERRRMDGMRAELATSTNKLERLNGKRERMETVILPDLEQKLVDIETEIDEAERGVATLEREDQTRLQLEETYLAFQRPRHHSAGHDNASWIPVIPNNRPTLRTHNPRSQSMHTSTTTIGHSPSRLIYHPPWQSLSTTSTDQPLSMSTSTRSSPGANTTSSISTSRGPTFDRAGMSTKGGSSTAGYFPAPDPVVGAGRPLRSGGQGKTNTKFRLFG